jgi:monothiol glutaredoxin
MTATTDTPTRRILPHARLTAPAVDRLLSFHGPIVDEVERAVSESPLVVVGMAQNPHVKNVRRALDDAGLAYKYLEYGSYLSKWKERLAIKLWSGWPTFPQVFVKGILYGGEDLTLAALTDGSLKKSLEPSS